MELHWTHLGEISPQKREKVEERLDTLAEGRNDLIDVSLVGHSTEHHRQGGKEVRVTALVRGKEVVATAERESLDTALDEAVEDFTRELKRQRERRRDRRAKEEPEPPHLAVIDKVFADRGYGFVLTDEGMQVYFHENAVSGGLRFGKLEEGQRVGLNVEAGEKGPQATVLLPAPPDASGP